MNAIRVSAILIALAGVGAGCGGRNSADPSARLEREASEVARFLAGYGRFDHLQLADSVDLYVAPEGGGGQQRFAREQLSDRAAWRVQSGRFNQSFVPRGMPTRLVPAVGKYMHCTPSELKTRFPQLASYPHVGIKLEPPNAKSCLESWNATFIFDTTDGRTRLIAAIYDQWEW
jgi:hypothetical protein